MNRDMHVRLSHRLILRICWLMLALSTYKTAQCIFSSSVRDVKHEYMENKEGEGQSKRCWSSALIASRNNASGKSSERTGIVPG